MRHLDGTNYGAGDWRLAGEPDPRAEEWREAAIMDAQPCPDCRNQDAPAMCQGAAHHDVPRWTEAEIERAKVDAERLYGILNAKDNEPLTDRRPDAESVQGVVVTPDRTEADA